VRKLVKLLLAAAAIGFGFLAYVYLTLPNVAELGATNPPTTAFMELRADEARARNVPPRRVQRWVPYSRISSSLKRAVLVAEDGTFWEHDGIDVTQIKESIERDLRNARSVAAAAPSHSSWRRTSTCHPRRTPCASCGSC